MRRTSSLYKAALFVLSLLPFGAYLYWFRTQALGPNPVEELTHATGNWTLYFLLASLAITPLRRFTGVAELIQARKMLGLFSFFYGCLHLLAWVWLHKFFDWTAMAEDLTEKRFLFAGMAGFALLLPLAITSTRGWIIRLGGQNWRRLHRLAYVGAIAGVVHYYWLVKSDVFAPLRAASVLAILLAARIRISWVRKRSPQT